MSNPPPPPSPPIDVLFTGSRDWRDKDAIRRALVDLTDFDRGDDSPVLVHGDCKGADKLAAEVASELGWTVLARPADWAKHGRAAGPIRNQAMIDERKPTHALACLLPTSRGTVDTIQRLLKYMTAPNSRLQKLTVITPEKNENST